jgi:fructuronate reductase
LNVVEKTKREPIWLHIGAGNLFRAFPAAAQQDLLDAGLTDRGIIACELYDGELIDAAYAPYENKTLLVSLHADGKMGKRVIESIAEAFDGNKHPERLEEILAWPGLQMVTFTITEKGYDNTSIMEKVARGLLARHKKSAPPLALVSLDNVSENGDKLKQGVLSAAEGLNEPGLADYARAMAYPWSMIDKITPRPSGEIAAVLKKDGYKNTKITQTSAGTFTAAFVNAEVCQYLVIENDFPNGRPPLEKAGVIFTDRETVMKAERTKVCACLNPLHTILAVGGMLLNHASISACMADEGLRALVYRAAYKECLPAAENPGVMEPEQFLREVLTERLPNPYIPDTPARIATDTSLKIPVRFGVNLKSRVDCNGTGGADALEAIPFFFAMWLRYLQGTDDNGQPLTLSPDPRLGELQAKTPREILSDASIFGVDLYAAGLGEKVEGMLQALATPGAVRKALDEMYK